MTDPKTQSQEPARELSEKETEQFITMLIGLDHCVRAENASKKSECAECGSTKGINVEFEKQNEDLIKGHVYGECCECGAPTVIGIYYANGEAFNNRKPTEIFRVSYSTKDAPVSIPF